MCKKCESLCISKISSETKKSKNNENSHEIYNFGSGVVLNNRNSAAEELLSR